MDFVPQEEFLQKLLEVLEDSFIPDSEIQKNVQDNLRTLQNNPEFCNYLLMVCESRQQFDDKMRALAALILKNTIVYFYNNIPAYLRQHMQQKCLNLLSDHSKEVRLGASVLINVVVQKEGIASIGNVIPHLLGLLVLDESEICTSAMKTLALIVEDYMHINMRMQTWQIDNQIVDLLGKFIELTGHQCIDVRHRAFRALNDVLQKHFASLSGVINTSTYLEKLVAFANEEDTDTVLLVLQGFVIFISNQDEAILPGLNDVIGYILNKSTSEDNDVALQACEFWLAVSKLPTCVDILRNHLKHLLPVLLNNMKYSDFELSILKDTLGKDVDEQDKAEDIRPFAKANDDDDEDPDISWTLRKCSAASLDALAVQYEQELIELVLPPIIKNLESTDLLLKESAILAFGAIADGCFNSLIKILPNLVPVLLQCMEHQYSLIRSITCWTLSRYTRFVVFYDDKLFLSTMMVFLEHSLDENKRVQRASLSAFCFFQEEAKMRLVPYVDMIMQTFLRGFDMYQMRSLYLLYDAIGVFATGIGTNFISMLPVLMPRLLGRFTNLDDYNNAEEFLALCECLSAIVNATAEEFNPYAEVPFVKCQGIISENNAEDEYDKDLVCGALQLLVSLAGGLKAHFSKFVVNTNLTDQLYAAVQDSARQVRQPALALLGELIRFCLPCISPHIHVFMPFVVENLFKGFNGICNNAAWVIGKMAMQESLHMTLIPFINQIIEHAVECLQCTDGVQTVYKTVAVTFCSLGLVAPDPVANSLKRVMRPLCITIRNVADCPEKEFAFRGLCELVLRSPDVFVNEFIFFCDAAASWQNIDKELAEKIRYMILQFRQHIGDEQWTKVFGEFPPLLKGRMNMLYGV